MLERRRNEFRKYFSAWRLYAKAEGQEMEFQRRLRQASARHRKWVEKKIFYKMKQYALCMNQAETKASTFANIFMLRKVLDAWSYITRDEARRRMLLYRLFDICSINHSKYQKCAGMQRMMCWKNLHVKLHTITCAIVGLVNGSKLNSSFNAWKSYNKALLTIEIEIKREKKLILWRWRALSERSLRRKRADRMVIEHWAKQMHRKYFFTWSKYVSREKELLMLRQELASPEDVKYNDIDFIRNSKDFQCYEENPPKSDVSYFLHLTEKEEDLIKLTNNKDTPRIERKFDPAYRTFENKKVTGNKSKVIANLLLPENMFPDWITQEIAKLEHAAEVVEGRDKPIDSVAGNSIESKNINCFDSSIILRNAISSDQFRSLDKLQSSSFSEHAKRLNEIEILLKDLKKKKSTLR